MYNEIKLHSESNSSNLMSGKYLLTTCTRMAFIGYISWYISPKGLYWYIIYFHLRKP